MTLAHPMCPPRVGALSNFDDKIVELHPSERSSSILNCGVEFAIAASATQIGLSVDHGDYGDVAGYDGSVGATHWQRCERSLHQLIQLVKSNPLPLPIEQWALASVAIKMIDDYFVLDQFARDDDPVFLKEFAKLIERISRHQYENENSSQR